MLIYTINEGLQSERTIKCPVAWLEMTLAVFQRLYQERNEGDDPIRIFSILTGTKYEQLWNEQSEILEAEIYRAVAFIKNAPQTFRVKPGKDEVIRISGKKVHYPTRLDKLTIGQNFMIRSRLEKAEKEGLPLETLVSYAAAVYLQPLVDEAPFNVDRANEIEQELLTRNIYDVFPIGFFWLSKLNNSGAGGLLYWLQKKRQTARRKMRSLRWPRLRSSARSTILACLIISAAHTASFHAWFSSSHSTRSCLSSTFGSDSQNSERDTLTSKGNETNN